MYCGSWPDCSAHSHAGRALKPRAPETGTRPLWEPAWSAAGAARVQAHRLKSGLALWPFSHKGKSVIFHRPCDRQPSQGPVHTGMPRDGACRGPGSPWGITRHGNGGSSAEGLPRGSPASSWSSSPGHLLPGIARVVWGWRGGL